MGFLDNNKNNNTPRDSAYLDIPGDGKKKTVRPLAKTPHTVWVHKINKVVETTPSGETQITRGFSTVMCTSTGRGGVGCAWCTTQDPLWAKLQPDAQTNRKTGTRVDFPKSTVHIMPVFDYDLQAAKIMKGGNQLYEPMDQWYDVQKSDADKDLRRCDWSVWKTGQGMKTQYSATRLDATPFTISPELEEAAKLCVQKAMDDLRIPADKVREKMYGETLIDIVAPIPPQVQTINAAPQPVQPTFAIPASAPAPVVHQPAPAATEQQDTLKSFISWVGEQPEFVGHGMVTNLIPFVREKNNGDINYHKLSAAQLLELKDFLQLKLQTLRSGK